MESILNQVKPISEPGKTEARVVLDVPTHLELDISLGSIGFLPQGSLSPPCSPNSTTTALV